MDSTMTSGVFPGLDHIRSRCDGHWVLHFLQWLVGGILFVRVPLIHCSSVRILCPFQLWFYLLGALRTRALVLHVGWIESSLIHCLQTRGSLGLPIGIGRSVYFGDCSLLGPLPCLH